MRHITYDQWMASCVWDCIFSLVTLFACKLTLSSCCSTALQQLQCQSETAQCASVRSVHSVPVPVPASVSVSVPVPMHSSEAYWGRGPVCALKDCRHRSTRVVGCYIVGGTCSLDGVDTLVTFLLSKHGAGDIRVWCW